MSDPIVQQIQAYLQSKRPLGVGYSLPVDGEVTDLLVSTLQYLQSGLATAAGHPVNLISGRKVNSNAIAEIEKALGIKPAKDPVEKPLPAKEPVPSLEDAVELGSQNKEWESFLNQSLPVVGKLYDGDVASSAKKLEAAISKEINKPVAGMIWSDTKKQFNTTPDDIMSALQKIEAHKKSSTKAANLSRDERYIKLADMIRTHDAKKI